MAQKGRGGPRTKYQRLCPDFFVPKWAPKHLALGGWLCYTGDGICPLMGLSTWATIAEDPVLGTFTWQGQVESHGDLLDWTVVQAVSFTRPGVDFVVDIQRPAGGWNISIYHYDTYRYDDDSPNFLTAEEFQFWDAPLGPVATLTLNMGRWSDFP